LKVLPHAVFAVDGKGVLSAGHAQDQSVAGEVDFDQDVVIAHLFQERGRVRLIHDVDAVADSFRVAQVERFPDVEAQAVRGHHSGSQLARVQSDVDLRVDGFRVGDHFHIEIVIVHRVVPIFGLHEIDGHDARSAAAAAKPAMT